MAHNDAQQTRAQASDAMLSAVCETLDEGIVLHRDGIMFMVNRAASAMFACPPEEMIGRHVLEFSPVEAHEVVGESIASGETRLYRTFGLRKDGLRFRAEIHSRVVPLAEGDVRVTVLRDLSERDQAQRDREISVSLLHAAVDSTADGLLVVGTNGRITLYNDRFLQIWGVPREAVNDTTDDALLPLCDKQLVAPETFRARVRALYMAPETESVDQLDFLDGRIVERYSRPQRVADRVIGRVWSFRDVTSKRRAERALELAVQMRDEFLGIASHELFTPITSLGVAIRGLRETDGRVQMVAEQRAKLFATAERQVERLARLVQELLDVTRIDGGHFSLACTEVDLCAVAKDVLDQLAPELERAKIAVHLDCAASIHGSWDRGRLEQAVANLLSNAVKFGQGKPIEISVRDIGAHAELSVRDQGIGVAEDQQALIFERFQRAVSSRHFAGLGLGLYITRQIVEAHDGVLRLASTPGQGSTFTIRLPRRRTDAP